MTLFRFIKECEARNKCKLDLFSFKYTYALCQLFNICDEYSKRLNIKDIIIPSTLKGAYNTLYIEFDDEFDMSEMNSIIVDMHIEDLIIEDNISMKFTIRRSVANTTIGGVI